MKYKFSILTNAFFAISGLFLFYMPDVSPEFFHLSVFFIFLIPVVIAINLFFVFYWLIRRPVYFCLISVAVLAAGYKYIDRTFSINFKNNEKGRFSVLSSNVRIFNVYSHLRDPDFSSSKEMIRWIKNNKADILCLQEFYSNNSKELNSLNIIGSKYRYRYFVPFITIGNAKWGMVIFSKFPIVGRGDIKFREKSNNQILFCDIKIGRDTIRVYNIHLQSMSIDEGDIVNSKFDDESKDKLINVLLRYKNGSIQRSRQIKKLVQHIQSCPYKTIVCGDLNELPYGYAYEQLSDLLDNSFQKAGTGFGFTYNGKLSFLRIDNQFADKKLEVNSFKVHNEIKYSDHYPVSASYSIR